MYVAYDSYVFWSIDRVLLLIASPKYLDPLLPAAIGLIVCIARALNLLRLAVYACLAMLHPVGESELRMNVVCEDNVER